jgi:hypothetical protein
MTLNIEQVLSEISKMTEEFAIDANLFMTSEQHLSNQYVELTMANVIKTAEGIQIANYAVSRENCNNMGFSKNYYTITDVNNGTILHENISLFETALSVIRSVIKKRHNTREIIRLDEKYDMYLLDATISKSQKGFVSGAKCLYSLDKAKLMHAKIKETLNT